MSPASPEERYKYLTVSWKGSGVPGGNMGDVTKSDWWDEDHSEWQKLWLIPQYTVLNSGFFSCRHGQKTGE